MIWEKDASENKITIIWLTNGMESMVVICQKVNFFIKIIHYLSWKTCLQEKTGWSLFFTLRFQLYMQNSCQ